MAKAKRLPSGSYRAQVYSHTDANGKRHYESFTAPTKAEAEMKAAEFAANKKRRAKNDLTVGEAIDGYIRAKEGVLSPSTVRGYVKMRQYYFASIEKKRLRSLTREDVQLFISGLSQEVSPKTVRNVNALFTASIALYSPDLSFKVTLPAKQIKRPVSPSDEAVKTLYEAAGDQMKISIAFAACGLRRGEICALRYEDIDGNIAHIHADMVRDKSGAWIYKDLPKTSDSDRFVKLPDSLLEMIGAGTGFIVKVNPDSITKRFERLRKPLGIDIRFHDLRHYFASIGAVLQIPDTYIADFGGWRRGGSVMKSIYQNNITSMSDYYSDRMTDHINEIIKEGGH